MPRRAGVLLILCLLTGCHAAGPVALKVAKLKAQKVLSQNSKKKSYCSKAITALEKQYDVNRDGCIDGVEAMYLKQREVYEKSMKQWRKMDLNGDGVVDSAEFEAAQEDANSK